MSGGIDLVDSDDLGFVEVDPTGRYGRYNEILGKGASKTVYRGFDEYEGIEVAWNQVKLHEFLQSPEDLERLYSEIHLLKTLNHTNIIKFYTSWIDTANRSINFVTEMFTSGTLRQYRLKHKKMNMHAIKRWCWQILQGLVYLHGRDPPVIHRDIKCDNIFVNGHHGEVKIGDLGLAGILRKTHDARCVGTPEFMAPEVYGEEYNELVDIYSFGMCVLEMVTFEYPYSECTHPAQIYKNVMSGKKPEALYRVKDPEVRTFVEKCLATVSDRLSARELLNEPFLQINDYPYDLRPSCREEYDETGMVLGHPRLSVHHCAAVNSNYIFYEQEQGLDTYSIEYESPEIDLFGNQEDDHLENVDITIRGRRDEDGSIFVRLRIADKAGHVRNIYFPFDIDNDTALCVATEMVAELDIMDQDVTEIAEMIDGEIAALVPKWRRGAGMEECPNLDRPHKKVEAHQCPRSMHSHFEEIANQSDKENAPKDSGKSDDVSYSDTWVHHHQDCDSSSGDNHFDYEHGNLSQSAKELLESSISDSDSNESMADSLQPILSTAKGDTGEYETKSFACGQQITTFPPLDPEKNGVKQKMYEYGCSYSSCSPVHLVTAKSFYSGVLIPHLATTSLPVDTTDF